MFEPGRLADAFGTTTRTSSVLAVGGGGPHHVVGSPSLPRRFSSPPPWIHFPAHRLWNTAPPDHWIYRCASCGDPKADRIYFINITEAGPWAPNKILPFENLHRRAPWVFQCSILEMIRLFFDLSPRRVSHHKRLPAWMSR
jgi:hypothetical protein